MAEHRLKALMIPNGDPEEFRSNANYRRGGDDQHKEVCYGEKAEKIKPGS
jgi:hypothetical protein